MDDTELFCLPTRMVVIEAFFLLGTKPSLTEGLSSMNSSDIPSLSTEDIRLWVFFGMVWDFFMGQE